jgi:hypothetical protein
MIAAPAANTMPRGDEGLKLKAILTWDWDEFEVSMLSQPNKGRLATCKRLAALASYL